MYFIYELRQTQMFGQKWEICCVEKEEKIKQKQKRIVA